MTSNGKALEENLFKNWQGNKDETGKRPKKLVMIHLNHWVIQMNVITNYGIHKQ